MKRLLLVFLLSGCGGGPPTSTPSGRAALSSTIAVTSDDKTLWVVNQDADSVSVIDVGTRSVAAEITLGPTPTVDATTMRYEPRVKPRALAILPGDKKVYVAAQAAGKVFVLDAASRAVSSTIDIGDGEPVAIVAAPDGKAVYVVSHEAATVIKIDPSSDTVVGTLPVGQHPWGASVSADGKRLYVTQFLLQPGLTVIDTASFTVAGTLVLADQPPDAAGKLVPNGVARGVYAAVPQPGTDDVWLPHLLLAVKTPEPALDFQSTVFPTISRAKADGSAETSRILFAPPMVPGAMGGFNDVVSGPRTLDFVPDGSLALVLDAQSEDLLILDGHGLERGLVRPIPATFPEGLVVDHAGKHAYVEGRNSHDVTVLAVDPTNTIAPVTVDGDPIDRLAADPMPMQLRLGQRLFYTANSAVFPITKNFWMACSTCHLEGRTDAVTWLFTVGPRDTPSNAGGPINTGFLLRQALRNSVVDYDNTIILEQGGNYHRSNPAQKAQLDQLAAFVNYAIPFPENPNRSPDGTLTASQQQGKTLFDARCASCHPGAYYTDSGQGNPTLDLAGPILLHNIGTCVTGGPFPDQPAPDEVLGKMHTACDFDTPTLRGIFDTAPYFHDGSAATLRDAVDRLPAATGLSDADKNALVDYLKTL